MKIPARYFDGIVAHSREVSLELIGSAEAGAWLIRDVDNNTQLAKWPAESIYGVSARKGQLRIGSRTGAHTARLIFDSPETADAARALLPALTRQRKKEGRSQFSLIAGSTAVLAAVMAGYIYGVPLLAGQIASAIPPAWERQLGATAAAQMEASISEQFGFETCDPNPASVANTAIARFVDQVLDGTDTPFEVSVAVTRTAVPNAFALPGGKVYYFSELLQGTKSADEFAGVLAHEIGHVVHRHGMEQLVSSAGTGLLIGFILGDMTGISIAGGLGSAIIDSRNSREAERQADAFSVAAAARLDFNPAALADLLDRIAEDDELATAVAFLSSHPLTQERRVTLNNVVRPDGPLQSAFTDIEWKAIHDMCASHGGEQASSGNVRADARAGNSNKKK